MGHVIQQEKKKNVIVNKVHLYLTKKVKIYIIFFFLFYLYVSSVCICIKFFFVCMHLCSFVALNFFYFFFFFFFSFFYSFIVHCFVYPFLLCFFLLFNLLNLLFFRLLSVLALFYCWDNRFFFLSCHRRLPAVIPQRHYSFMTRTWFSIFTNQNRVVLHLLFFFCNPLIQIYIQIFTHMHSRIHTDTHTPKSTKESVYVKHSTHSFFWIFSCLIFHIILFYFFVFLGFFFSFCSAYTLNVICLEKRVLLTFFKMSEVKAPL